MKLHLLNTGYCTTHEAVVLRGGAWRTIKAHALAALIEHPKGWILFDTGYAPRVVQAFQVWPYRIYGWLTPTFLGTPVVEQLPRFGLKPDDIRWVILSHLHADHVGGVRDFPSSRFVLSKAAWQHAKGQSGWPALRQAFIPDLLPPDFESRLELIENLVGPALPHLGPTHDVLGDGRLRLVSLPGHALGQMGLLVEDHTLLAADGCWHSQAYRENRPPALFPLHFIFDDAKATLDTIHNLHRFHQTCPQVRIVPTHCPEVAEGLF